MISDVSCTLIFIGKPFFLMMLCKDLSGMSYIGIGNLYCLKGKNSLEMRWKEPYWNMDKARIHWCINGCLKPMLQKFKNNHLKAYFYTFVKIGRGIWVDGEPQRASRSYRVYLWSNKNDSPANYCFVSKTQTSNNVSTPDTWD